MALPEIVLDIGFSGPDSGDYFTIGDATRGAVNDKPIGPGDVWSTIPLSRIKSWRVRYGASSGDQPTQRYEAATAEIVLHDPFREFDPENLAGPYVAGGRSLVEAMVRVRIRAVWGDSYPIFYGFADDFEPDYQGNTWTYVTLTATDPTKVFAALDRDALVSPVGASEDSGARVTRVLDAAGWPAVDRLISAGDTTLQATDMAGNANGELQLVQDTELGEFYFDRSGRAVFRNRHAMWVDTRSRVSQATFGDDPAGYAISDEIPYADAKPSKPDDGVVNRVLAARAGGVQQNVEDASSVGRYLPKTHSRLDLLMETDAEALSWANAILYQYARPQYRFARLELNTPSDVVIEDATWPRLLSSEIGNRITVRRRPAGGGAVIEKDCFIRGFEYASDGVAWTSTLILQSAERYAFFVIGDPVLGVVGSNAIAY